MTEEADSINNNNVAKHNVEMTEEADDNPDAKTTEELMKDERFKTLEEKVNTLQADLFKENFFKEKKKLEEKVETLQARSVSELIESITTDDHQSHSKMVYLTNFQAIEISKKKDAMKQMLEGFYGDNKPSLVINLAQSYGFRNSTTLMSEEQFEQLGEKRVDLKGIGPKKKDEVFSLAEEGQLMGRLEIFIRDVIIPLAEHTNAVIICNAIAQDCILTETLNTVVNSMSSRWIRHGKLPFTIVKFLNQVEVLYMKDETDINESNWFKIMRQNEHWKERNPKLMKITKEKIDEAKEKIDEEKKKFLKEKTRKAEEERRKGTIKKGEKNEMREETEKKERWWRGHDVDFTFGHLIIVEGYDMSTNKPKKDHHPSSLLLNSLLNSLSETSQSITIKTGATPRRRGRFNPRAVDQISMHFLTDRVHARTHVLCIDVRNRKEENNNKKAMEPPLSVALVTDSSTTSEGNSSEQMSTSEGNGSEEISTLEGSGSKKMSTSEGNGSEHMSNLEGNGSEQMSTSEGRSSKKMSLSTDDDSIESEQVGTPEERKIIQWMKDNLFAENPHAKNKESLDCSAFAALHHQLQNVDNQEKKFLRESTKLRRESASVEVVEKEEERSLKEITKPEDFEKEKESFLKETTKLNKKKASVRKIPKSLKEKIKEKKEERHKNAQETDVYLSKGIDIVKVSDKFATLFFKQYEETQRQFHEEKETMRQDIQALLSSEKVHSINIWDKKNEIQKFINEKIIFESNLPGGTPPLEGLELLEEAWMYVDKTKSDADRYRSISKIFFLLELFCGFLVTLFSIWGSQWAHETHKEILKSVVLGVSLILTAIVSIETLLSPRTMWRQLRVAQIQLESMIWKYRMRFGAFRTDIINSSEPEDNLHEEIEKWKIYLHSTNPNISGTTIPHDVGDLKKSLKCSFKKMTFTSEQTPLKTKDGEYEDDHYSYLSADQYIKYRVKPVTKEFQDRLPKSVWFQQIYGIAMILVGVVIAFISQQNLQDEDIDTGVSNNDIVIILTAVVTMLRTWSEFNSLDQSNDLFTGAIATCRSKEQAFVKTPAYHHTQEQTAKLVEGVENIVVKVVESWSSFIADPKEKVLPEKNKMKISKQTQAYEGFDTAV